MKNITSHKHTTPQPMFRRVCALVFAMTTAFAPTFSSAAGIFPGLIGRTVLPFVPPAGTLPVLLNPNLQPDGATVATIGNQMTITQNQEKDKVIIDWSKFNIGSGAMVRFYQGSGNPNITDITDPQKIDPNHWKPNSNYAALNRIYDLSPSVINGSLVADGKVYLINRNGVFFGPQGKVQVQSLVASAFNISDANFNSGRLIFDSTPYDSNQTTPVSDSTTISNEGTITAKSGGSVFFVGPNVQNLGSISAPGGKIDLVGLKADGQVEIKEIIETRSPEDVIYADTSLAGDVANMKGGSLLGPDGGWIGLHGNTVRNDGLIRAVTTRRQNGVVFLLAKDLAATGEGSVTDVEVSDATEAMGRIALNFSPGTVVFDGLFGQGTNALARIDHEGSITAHAGDVRMEAVERVFLGGKSSIDVSGLTIERPMSDQVNRPNSDQFIEAQLNSLYLRDDYGQKSGSTLPGSTATVDVVKGSAIGNLSTYYLGMPKDAQDLSTIGGKITIGAPAESTLGDIIISKGAGINISGGKVTYSGSAPASSKVIGTDGRVYDISSAPQWLTYTGILGSTSKSYGKFGSEMLQGISFGGHLMSLKSTLADRVVGGNAGSMTIRSRVITGLDDGLDLRASVTTGFNQTVTTPHLDSDKDQEKTDTTLYQRYLDYLISQNRGLEAPTGGKVVIGNKVADTIGAVGFQEDAAVSSIVVKKSSVSAAPVMGWDGAVLNSDTPTEISADMISKAGLSSLALYANTSIKTEKDAEIVLRPGGGSWITTGKNDKDGKEILRPGGNYNATARRIEFLGAISAPGGSVDMLIRPNVTSSGTQQVAETIFLGGDSRISTAGERIDNSTFGLSPLDMRKGGFTSGGYISLTQVSPTGVFGYPLTQNNESSIVIKEGALLDVSGGWLINEKGTVSGGNAGSLTVKAPTISLGGELRGFALAGKDGGEIVLHAQEVQVAAQGKQFKADFGSNDTIPADLVGKLVLGADHFRDSGFSRISLSATDNLTVAEGVVLSPSLTKYATPDKSAAVGATCNAGECFSTVYPTFLDQIGKTSLSLNAGTNVYSSTNLDPGGNPLRNNPDAKLTIAQGAVVKTEAGGAITLNAPHIEIAGTVSAPGGSVTAKSIDSSKNDIGSITVLDTGKITTAGYNKTGIVTKADQPAPLPVPKDGGTVTLEALDIFLNKDSLVDVSGSERIEGQVRDADGVLTSVAVAGNGGSLSLVYAGKMQLEGTMTGAGGNIAGKLGGNLTVKNTTSALTLNATDVDYYQNSGFDNLTFASVKQITVPANLNLTIGRELTLDSPLIQGTGIKGDVAIFNAPWIRLINSGITPASPPGAATDRSGGAISFLGRYLDLQGSLLVQGFSGLNLQAEHDLTFADYYNSDPNVKKWLGELGSTAANLTLQANRIYPTTASSFTITTPGKVTTLPGPDANHDLTPIYSAGGSLTITAAEGIDHQGFLAAPMGGITLDSGTSGRLELAEGSVITTAGSVPVAYGSYDTNGSAWWSKYVDSSNTGTEVTAAPAKTITLKGKEVVVRNGAVQDLSGGGSVYASYWQSGLPGSKNPLTVSGRYVILPDDSASQLVEPAHLPYDLPSGPVDLAKRNLESVYLTNGSVARNGESVYLEAMPELGLKAGIYTLLPGKYAFLPGALVIQDTGTQLLAGQRTISKERYPVVGGYMTVRDTPVASQMYQGFSVRRAEEVLKEGDFTTKNTFSGGDGGSFAFNAKGTAKFDGTLKLDSLAGYKQGNVSFVAGNVEVVDNVDAGLAPSSTLQLDGKKLSDLHIGVLQLGDSSTRDVTVQNGVILNTNGISLTAGNSVTLKDGAQVNATDGYASITTPDGTFTLGDKSKLTATNGGVKLDVTKTSLSTTGTIDAGQDGSFSLTSNNIKFDDASLDATEDYFHMTKNLEKIFNETKYKSFSIASRGEIDFLRDVNLTTGSLTMDAARYVASTAGNVNFTATDITLLNSGATNSNALSNNGGTLSFTADNITVAPRLNGSNGNVAFDKFGTVKISSKNDLVFKGAGTIATGGDLTLSAARVTTSSDRYKADGSATVANVTIDGRNGAVTLNGNTGTGGTSSTPGGSLQILGNTISQNGGLLDVAAGQIGLTATSDITIKSAIKAMGSEQTAASGEKVYYNGGRITLQSDGGKVDLKNGAGLDVSAAVVTDKDGKIVRDANGAIVRKGDAGSIVLSATAANKGGIVKDSAAQLTGTAGNGGKGGSFYIDSASASAVTGGLDGVGGLDGLSDTLKDGGFNNLINIRSRSGDLALANGNTLTGREVMVAADNGNITIGKMIDQPDGSKIASAGHIKADTTDGSGRIELYAGKKLTIGDKSTLSARGTDSGANGGTVQLSSQDASNNALNVNDSSTIDVSSGGGSGTTGGTVQFRAYRNAGNTDVNMGAVSGTIIGASRVSVEAVKAYTNVTNVGPIVTASGYGKDAYDFLTDTNAAAIKNRLFTTNALNSLYHLQAGIEISSAASTNLTVNSALDLSTVRPGGEAVVLTLKSGKDLLINQSLTDAPTAIGTLHSYQPGSTVTMQNSTAINLVAGSDGGASYMGVAKGSALTAGTGDLTIDIGKWVYTENGPIRFAAGRDANFKGTTTGPNTMINADMKYNLGSYGGSVRGDVGRDLKLEATGSAIQTALGNIDIRTGHDLNLGSTVNTGAIRTTGEYDNSAKTATQPGKPADTDATRSSYWTYHNGGSIRLDVGNGVNGNLNQANGWDGAYIDSSVRAALSTQFPWYLAAGFGGSKENSQSANIPVTVGIATMGGGDVSVRTGGSLLTQIGAFGRGNVEVATGEDMTGRFRIMNGSANLTSAGGFGTIANPVVTELADGQVRIAAIGDVRLGTVQNPDNTRDRLFFVKNTQQWNMTYAKDSSFSASSLRGELALSGTNNYNSYTVESKTSETGRLVLNRKNILPASIDLSAAEDITVMDQFILAPSDKGNLGLFAGGSIRGGASSIGSAPGGFVMQDVDDITSMYGWQPDTGSVHYGMLTADVHHEINHLGDLETVKVKAGKDISNLTLRLNKPAEVTAEGDINKLYFFGQNTTPESLTSIRAGGSIDQGSTDEGLQPPTIDLGGPGTLLVQAGKNIRLGDSGGINSIGNTNNSGFSGTGKETDSDLIVSAGAYSSASMAKPDVKAFFAAIRDASDELSRLKADGMDTEAALLLAATEKAIRTYFYEYDRKKPELFADVGNLDLVDSAISSRSGSIYAMAGSNINVGRTALNSAPKKTSGITALYGGELSVYAGNDINVNESRLMTYMGGKPPMGDITIWSDQGDINAGRGSKTVVSAPTPVYTFDSNGVLTNITFTPPSAGSGIRALTFDSDGSGPIVAPDAGNIHIYAKGTLDAGEAGIQGNKLFLAASAVLNSQNIGFSAGSVGVPASNQNTVSIGPMTGATDMAATSKMIDTMSGGGADAAKKSALAEAEDFLMKYLDVKVIDLSEGTL